MKFFLDYKITGTGWAEASFRQGDTMCQMTASYLRDSLEELASAATQLRNGSEQATVIFMDEPGEHQVHLFCSSGELRIEVRWFDDWASWDIGPKSFEVVSEFRTDVARFRHQVLNVLNDLYASLGPEHYREEWVEHDFPIQQYEQLAAA